MYTVFVIVCILHLIFWNCQAARGFSRQARKEQFVFDHLQKFNDFSGSEVESAIIQMDHFQLLRQHRVIKGMEFSLTSAVSKQLPETVAFLLSVCDRENLKGVLINHKSLLHLAASEGNLDIIGQLLDAGADINQQSTTGVTPIMESKNGDVAHFLIQRGADIHHIIETLWDIEQPLVHILKRRPIHDSATLEVVEVLLKNGASTSKLRCFYITQLIVALTKNGRMDTLKLLLESGANLSDRDNNGNTAFMNAMGMISYVDNVSTLVQIANERTGVLNAQNYEGLTALMYALRNTTMVKELIRHGADVNVKDKYGNTAFFHALFYNICCPETVKILIKAGCDVNYQNNAGLSPLMVAATYFRRNSISILLDSGADVNAVSKKDNTSTALACLLNIPIFCEEAKYCIKMLLDRGGRFHYLSPVVLFNMILHGYTEVIPQLIQCGFAPEDISSDKMPPSFLETATDFSVSPLSMALLVGNIALARYFVETVFLTKSDLSSLTCNKELQLILETKNYQDSLDFLDDFIKQPFSLFTRSILAVSSAVGTFPEREKRVNMLPLPQLVKDILLFKAPGVSEMVSASNRLRVSSFSYVGHLSWHYSLIDGDLAKLKWREEHADMFQHPVMAFRGMWGIANRLN